MAEFLETASKINTLVIFGIIYVAFVSLLSSGIAHFLSWFDKQWSKLCDKLFHSGKGRKQ